MSKRLNHEQTNQRRKPALVESRRSQVLETAANRILATAPEPKSKDKPARDMLAQFNGDRLDDLARGLRSKYGVEFEKLSTLPKKQQREARRDIQAWLAETKRSRRSKKPAPGQSDFFGALVRRSCKGCGKPMDLPENVTTYFCGRCRDQAREEHDLEEAPW